MQDIIRGMAQLDVPRDVLERINMGEVLDKFRRNFKRLDDLKNFRNKHEERNFLSRWWNNDELEDAQLDAQEVQAEFSKTIGQLMVISMLQSQRLEQQQRQISQQQSELRKQADSIQAHAAELDRQQEKLGNQADATDEAVKLYLELRGLTQERARELIGIATEVKKTKDALLSAFHERLQVTRDLVQDVESKVTSNLASLEAAFDAKTSELDSRLIKSAEDSRAQHEGLASQMRANLKSLASKISTALLDENRQRTTAVDQLMKFTGDLAKDKTAVEQRIILLDCSFAEFKSDSSSRHSEVSDQMACLQQTVHALQQDLQSQRLDALRQAKRLKFVFAMLVCSVLSTAGYMFFLT